MFISTEGWKCRKSEFRTEATQTEGKAMTTLQLGGDTAANVGMPSLLNYHGYQQQCRCSGKASFTSASSPMKTHDI